MNIDNERYKVSLEFNFRLKISPERVKKIFGLDSPTEPGYLKPRSNWKGICFKIYEGMLWAMVEEDNPSWVKIYNITYDSIPSLIKKIRRLPTENLVITVYDTKTSTMKLVLAKLFDIWEINNGYRGAVLGKTIYGCFSRSSNSERLREYISET